MSRFTSCIWMDVRLFHHHSLKRFSLLPSCCLCSFVKDRLTVFTWVYFQALSSALFTYRSVCLFFHQYHTLLIIVVVYSESCSRAGGQVFHLCSLSMLYWLFQAWIVLYVFSGSYCKKTSERRRIDEIKGQTLMWKQFQRHFIVFESSR